MFQLEGNSLTVTASDSETTLKTIITIEDVAEGGEITIPAKLLIVIVVTWRWTGYNMILFLAAMQNIPEDYYEAATIDGANSWQKFLYVTLPSLKPIILFTSIMSTIGTLNLFTEPFLLTNGGPNNGTMTLGLYIYNQAFVSLNMTYAATISVIILLIVGALTFIQLKLGDKK